MKTYIAENISVPSAAHALSDPDRRVRLIIVARRLTDTEAMCTDRGMPRLVAQHATRAAAERNHPDRMALSTAGWLPNEWPADDPSRMLALDAGCSPDDWSAIYAISRTTRQVGLICFDGTISVIAHLVETDGQVVAVSGPRP